jgi:hypothetical protein
MRADRRYEMALISRPSACAANGDTRMGQRGAARSRGQIAGVGGAGQPVPDRAGGDESRQAQPEPTRRDG